MKGKRKGITLTHTWTRVGGREVAHSWE